jgi:hypothetical protein
MENVWQSLNNRGFLMSWAGGLGIGLKPDKSLEGR